MATWLIRVQEWSISDLRTSNIHLNHAFFIRAN